LALALAAFAAIDFLMVGDTYTHLFEQFADSFLYHVL
jgi:hypothetical protein